LLMGGDSVRFDNRECSFDGQEQTPYEISKTVKHGRRAASAGLISHSG